MMSLLDEMVSFSKLLSFEEECLTGRHSMSVNISTQLEIIMRKFGIFAFPEIYISLLLITMVIKFIIYFAIRGGQVETTNGSTPCIELNYIFCHKFW